jgi:hypothetical protein
MIILSKSLSFTSFIAATIVATAAAAEDDWRASYTLYGTPGIIDMPSAVAPTDGEIAATVSGFAETLRTTFSFQVLPRLSGSFRYSHIYSYDRSFDLQYQLAGEGQFHPSLAIGLRDFLGTGLYSSEYLVATKTLAPYLRLSGGLGWGRMGSLNGFSNPLGVFDDAFETRPNTRSGKGGTVLSGRFFRGDAALFGGVEWRVDDEWTVLAEYSSDAYTIEDTKTDFTPQSPLNFGVTWTPNDSFQFGAYYMYGSEIGVSATLIVDPTSRSTVGGLDSAPFPVSVRSHELAAAASWDTPQVQTAGVEVLGQVLEVDGFRLLGAEIDGTTMRVRYQNTQYRAEAQGVGRVSRVLTLVAPSGIDTFVLEPSRRGIALSSVTIRRSDLEILENEPNAAALSYDRAVFRDAEGPAPAIAYEDEKPALLWGITPYLELAMFDGDKPVRGDIGVEAAFQYELRPNIVLAGAYRQRLIGNRDEVGAISPSTLPDVRRTGLRYGAQSGRGIESLFVAWYGRPGRDLYSRVTAGYLERGFAGVSTEVLWKQVDNPLAFGAELNYALLRDFDLGFGFRPACSDPACTVYTGDDYGVVTGHLSAYYNFANGFQTQVDVGRYLAGDWGATFGLDREFNNGWKVGAYFTLTDVDFDDFGEGSFDKGIRIEIPIDAILGTPTRVTRGTTLTSLERDGGARLRIDGRLYDLVEDGHQGQMSDNWGRFWR